MSGAPTKSERIDVRIAPEHKELIEKAAAIAGTSVAQFILSEATAAAKELLDKQHVIEMSERDYERFVQTLDANTEPTEAARKAAKRFNAGEHEEAGYRW